MQAVSKVVPASKASNFSRLMNIEYILRPQNNPGIFIFAVHGDVLDSVAPASVRSMPKFE